MAKVKEAYPVSELHEIRKWTQFGYDELNSHDIKRRPLRFVSKEAFATRIENAKSNLREALKRIDNLISKHKPPKAKGELAEVMRRGLRY